MTSPKIGTKQEWLEARLELLKKEKAHSRNRDELTRERQALPWVKVEKEYTFEGLTLNYEAHQAYVDGNEIALTALEFRLLKHLIDRKGRVQTRDQLLEDVWGYSSDVTTRTVDTHIKRLREKLGSVGEHIQTIRGVGYRFSRNSE